MFYDILAYIIIFIAFAYPFYNIYNILFLKKPLGCANCNSNCALRDIKKTKSNVNINIKKL